MIPNITNKLSILNKYKYTQDIFRENTQTDIIITVN